MFDRTIESHTPDATTAPEEPIHALRASLAALPLAADPRSVIEQLEELERLKSAICATQARLSFDLDQHRQAQAHARRLLEPRRRQINPDAGTGTEIALARRESPHDGRRKLRLARALLTDLPHTLAALERGDLNERRAEIITTETTDLTPAHRRGLDTTLSSQLVGLGDADLRDLVRREVLRRDEAGWLTRHARARTRRRVHARILGDGMGQLTAILPATDVSAIMTTLDTTADKARNAGDDRTRAQLLADTLTHRLGGLTGTTATTPSPVALKVVVSAETLLDTSTEPGYVPGAGHIPASLARHLATTGAQHLRSTIQRLFAAPTTGALVALESTSSYFRHGLADLIDLRDRRCRTPYCNAPIRHHDHVTARAHGGRTTLANGQGLCEACNHAKETPGFHHQTVPDPLAITHILITTPTGHAHHSRAPDPPTTRHDTDSPAERRLRALLLPAA
jgi:hypothetical protein